MASSWVESAMEACAGVAMRKSDRARHGTRPGFEVARLIDLRIETGGPRSFGQSSRPVPGPGRRRRRITTFPGLSWVEIGGDEPQD